MIKRYGLAETSALENVFVKSQELTAQNTPDESVKDEIRVSKTVQGILNTYFSKWYHISYLYNTDGNFPEINPAVYHRFGHRVKIARFSSDMKPWFVPYNVTDKQTEMHAGELGLIPVPRPLYERWWPLFTERVKPNLNTFLRLLIQYYGRLAIKEKPVFSLMDKLMVHIYELTQMSPGVAAEVFKRILQNEQSEFQTLREKKRPVFLGLDTLLYLKLASLLFPTSDYSHPVTTPALLLMGQLLSQCPVHCERDVAFGLFLCNLCSEYVSQSKRFVPEVVSFLHGVLFLAAKKEEDKIERLSGSVKPVGKAVNLLYINNKESRSCDIKPMKMSKVFGTDVEKTSLSSSDFKLCLIHCCISLIEDFSTLYTELPAYKEIFSPLVYMCSKLPVEYYPQTLKEKILSVVKQLESRGQKSRQSLVYCKAKPKPLPMFEPQVEEVWDGQKKKGGKDRAYNEKQRLLHKVKRERKGAVREIRKDTQFLARHKLQETMQKDADRKRKVKALYGNLANQEGDYKALKRKKTK